MEIKKRIYYVGVNDRQTSLFEALWALPYGVSYNSYLIDDDKVALIDTVEAGFFPLFLKKIRDVLNGRSIDYLIINHMEPDHSGCIAQLLCHYPDLTIVGNKKSLEMVAGYYGAMPKSKCVVDGENLHLGSHTLRFYLTPMVHWPETMMTLESVTGTLFSGDAFGCFGALNGGVTDKQTDTALYMDEMVRYYACIVGKYGAPVQNALKKLKNIPLQMICPAHGPVWEETLRKVIAEYDRMSLYKGGEGVVIAYGSMYGNSEEMADIIAEELALNGIRQIAIHNLSKSNLSNVLADVFRYNGLIVGCPTYNGTLFPKADRLLKEIAERGVQGRFFASFGSFTWCSAIAREMNSWIEKLKFECVGTSIENKQGINAETLNACRILARDMAKKVKGE